MRKEITYKWRIKWGGRWTTTSIHMTEEHVRKEHPEATPVDGTRIERMVPDTEAELQAAMYSRELSTGAWLTEEARKQKIPQPEGQGDVRKDV